MMLWRVADAVEARTARVHDDGIVMRLTTGVDGLGVRAQQESGLVTVDRPGDDGHLPGRADGTGPLGRRVVERLLAQDPGAPRWRRPVSTAQTDEGKATLEDPAVHDVSHRFAARLFDGVPEVRGLGVAEAVRLEILPNPGAEVLGPEVALEHAQHPGTLLVRQD